MVVVDTGASSGIGRATALALAERGEHVVLAARGADLLEEARHACEQAGAASATAVPTDVRSSADVDALLARAVADHGRVDAVVHAAMVMAFGSIEDLPEDVLVSVVDTAVHGTAHVARATLPVFRDQDEGTLVVVTSILASLAVPGIGAYVAGKWGQAGLLRTLQLETRDTPGIRVEAVAPGPVDTPIYQRAANVEGHLGKAPPPKVDPEHVAGAILGIIDGGRAPRSLLNAFLVYGERLFTPVYDHLVGPIYRRLVLSGQVIPPTDGNVLTPSGPAPEPPS
jgi:NAD(P)-dependent dehydrogenase (short-subunit alcohol dehydrogenase family)